jgi:UDP-2-acetamido-2,6-beta-L-arabino-hexul-4-ose reductase
MTTAPAELRIAVTGASGFMGQNLLCRLTEGGYQNVTAITRNTETAARAKALREAQVIFHLAGINRPADPNDFATGNIGVAEEVANALAETTARPLVIYASSSRASEDTPYGSSKRRAEEVLLGQSKIATVLAYRLPNVFGKWSKPNYNSAVATFCYNLSRGIEITVNEAAPLTLIYIDDIIDEWLEVLAGKAPNSGIITPRVTYQTTVGEVARILRSFAESRDTALLDGVGTGLTRALYATYVSFLPHNHMAYPITSHTDARGSFSEMLRTGTTGQFSYFTAHPGITRGGHYHHTKTEKFLVLSGTARFRFRHVLSNETREIVTEGGKPTVVETLPGWAHDVTNIGDSELICMLWANELFDKARPDTIAAKVF